MKIGIIGGSGLDDPEILKQEGEEEVKSPYGNPSSEIKTGKIAGIDICILARHGKKHTITPTEVNNRANIFALKKLGCTHILSTTAVGSLREEIKPGDLVVLDQFIDFTRHRKISFYENFENGIEHASLADPFSESLREKIIGTIKKLGFDFHDKGTVITIEGPRFSTRAESNVFRQWGADVINMSVAPEATLAKEAGLEYASIAMSTDYDCWKTDEEAVTAEMVFDTMRKNAEKVKQVLIKTIEKFSENKDMEEHSRIIKDSIRTIPHWPKQGIMFRDITTLLKDQKAMSKVMEIFVKRYKDKEIQVIAGIESRGFIFGSILAEKLGVSFVPIRKPGKLPGETIKQEYELEYGTDAVEVHSDAISYGEKVLIVDDLLATGGTMKAACNLVEKLRGEIVECAFVVDLPDLNGKEKLNHSVFSIVSFKGE